MLTAVLPPQAVPVYGGFDYITVDAQRRRVYAAHGKNDRLLVADADSGKVLGQVRVGAMAGVAVDPATGHVFTGNGDDDSVSEVDPVALSVVRTVEVPGHVDAIAYDAALRRIYADEDDGTRLFVIDAATMTLQKTIVLPGHKPEYLAIDPKTHVVYQNIANLAEVVVIDPRALSVARTIPTPELTNNHPLQYDAAYGEIVVGGLNGQMSAYTPEGVRLGTVAVPRFDQCDLDPTEHVVACAGGGGITRLQLHPGAGPSVIDTTPLNDSVHNDAIDPQTHAVFAAWTTPDGSGDFFGKFAAPSGARP